jgi:hypothetical protein|tara:strand:- start:324 stop:1247 length:924 start_codon:yes stop_codon:yes gene_type:complete
MIKIYKLRVFFACTIFIGAINSNAQTSDSTLTEEGPDPLTQVFDGTLQITNETFGAKLVGIYANHFNSSSAEYGRGGLTLQSYYPAEQLSVVQQLKFSEQWDWSDSRNKIEKDWQNVKLERYSGPDCPAWFRFEFLRGKLLTIISPDLVSEDYLFTGFIRNDKGSLGAEGMTLTFTSDDEKQFSISTIVGSDDEIYLVITPDLMENLGLGSLVEKYQGQLEFYLGMTDQENWKKLSANDIEQINSINSKPSPDDYSGNDEYYKEKFTYQRFSRSQNYWSIVRNKSKRIKSHTIIPQALIFQLVVDVD